MHSRCRWFLPTIIVFSHRMFPLLSSYWGLSRWGVSGLCPLSTPFCQSSWKPPWEPELSICEDSLDSLCFWKFGGVDIFLSFWYVFFGCDIWDISDIFLKDPPDHGSFPQTQGAMKRGSWWILIQLRDETVSSEEVTCQSMVMMASRLWRLRFH